ncbi:MAG: tRNA glutamyl-Q synthetase [Halobacteriovoraceae bacterium]|nr:tRNA glutamyl-Q synthetase [Halobacteriovoraceae bacterium]
MGNLLNFYLTWKLIRKSGGQLILRIDDMDASRMRPEYVAEIFRSLEFLDIDWDHGPTGVDDFFKNHSQGSKTEYYREQLENLKNSYACSCSRSQIKKESVDGKYPGTCRELNLTLQKDFSALRIRADHLSLGDFVIWRKDDLPSYQLVSLLEDSQQKVNFILRGEDLLASSEAQVYLAKEMEIVNFQKTQIVHHSLLRNSVGEKLSKSNSSAGLNDLKIEKNQLIAELDQLAEEISFF